MFDSPRLQRVCEWLELINLQPTAGMQKNEQAVENVFLYFVARRVLMLLSVQVDSLHVRS